MAPSVRSPPPVRDSIETIVVTDDREYGERVEAALDPGEFAVGTAPSIRDGVAAADDADCLVLDVGASVRDGSGARRDAIRSIERVRRRAPELPILLAVETDASGGLFEAIRARRWVECVDRSVSVASPERVAHRIRTLVERRRLDALSRRSLTGIELAGDGIGIAAPDGDLEFVNRSFAMRFGYDSDDLVGRPWRALFTEASVERVETVAVPTVADGWHWTGTCTGRRESGETVPVRVRLGGSGDDSLVFVVREPGPPAERDDDRP